MANESNNQVSIEDLAVMVSRGLTEIQNRMATKDDLRGVKDDLHGVKDDLNGVKDDLHGVKDDLNGVKDDLHGVKETVKIIMEELNATHEDVRYVRNTVTMLVQSDVAHEAAIEELKVRVWRLEQRAGLAA